MQMMEEKVIIEFNVYKYFDNTSQRELVDFLVFKHHDIVPRIGETLLHKSKKYKVQDVVYMTGTSELFLINVGLREVEEI